MSREQEHPKPTNHGDEQEQRSKVDRTATPARIGNRERIR
jgi:hypothetical protein